MLHPVNRMMMGSIDVAFQRLILILLNVNLLFLSLSPLPVRRCFAPLAASFLGLSSYDFIKVEENRAGEGAFTSSVFLLNNLSDSSNRMEKRGLMGAR